MIYARLSVVMLIAAMAAGFMVISCDNNPEEAETPPVLIFKVPGTRLIYISGAESLHLKPVGPEYDGNVSLEIAGESTVWGSITNGTFAIPGFDIEPFYTSNALNGLFPVMIPGDFETCFSIKGPSDMLMCLPEDSVKNFNMDKFSTNPDFIFFIFAPEPEIISELELPAGLISFDDISLKKGWNMIKLSYDNGSPGKTKVQLYKGRVSWIIFTT